MKLAVGCVVFDDVQGVKRLIETCYKEVDYIFVIDGKYKEYDSVFPFSTDGLDELDYPNVILEEATNLHEYQKRSVYLDLCKEYDITHLLIVDSDEYFHPDSNFKTFREEIKHLKDYIYNIKNYTAIMGMITPVDQPRLWVNPTEIEYKNKRHYQFGLIGHDSVLVAKRTLYSIKLIHDPHLRNEERIEKHDTYIKRLEEYEKFMQLWECNKEKAQREFVVWNS